MSRSVQILAMGILLAPVAALAGPRIDTVPVAVNAVSAETLEQHEITLTNVVGDIVPAVTPNDGRVHLRGYSGAATTDYFRGVYAGDPDDLDEISGYAGVVAGIEVLRGPQGTLFGDNDSLSLIAGFTTAIADEPEDFGVDSIWYSNNHYASLAGRFGGFTPAVTYTVYDSPNGLGLNNFEEIAAALGYTGDNFIGGLNPQVKWATRTRGVTTGESFLQGSITPSFQPIDDSPLVIQIPIVVGMGLGDYYFEDADDPIFAEGGVYGIWPLDLSSEWGNWSIYAGVNALWREDELVDIDPFFAEGDDWIISGTIGISLAY